MHLKPSIKPHHPQCGACGALAQIWSMNFIIALFFINIHILTLESPAKAPQAPHWGWLGLDIDRCIINPRRMGGGLQYFVVCVCVCVCVCVFFTPAPSYFMLMLANEFHYYILL